MKMYYYLFYCFVVYAFIGWNIEVVYHLYTQKRFVNRGFLYGPLCPIYGSTAVLLIAFLTPLGGNGIYIFLGGVFVASVVEYVTGYLLEILFHARWWNYSKEKFNVKGYICLKFSIFWGAFAVVFIKLINPRVSKLIYIVMDRFGDALYSIIFAGLIVDIVFTINSLIAFRYLFLEIEEVLIETKSNMDKLLEKTLTLEGKTHIQERIEYLHELRERLSRRVSLRHKAMLRAYPKITSRRFGTAIKEIRENIEKYKSELKK